MNRLHGPKNQSPEILRGPPGLREDWQSGDTSSDILASYFRRHNERYAHTTLNYPIDCFPKFSVMHVSQRILRKRHPWALHRVELKKYTIAASGYLGGENVTASFVRLAASPGALVTELGKRTQGP